MFEKMTMRARNVVPLAVEEARELKHNFVGTEHLLLGLLRTDGEAARLLKELPNPLTLEDCRMRVRNTTTASTSTPSNPPLTPRTKRALTLADEAAVAGGLTFISDQHILIGLLDTEGGMAQEIFRAIFVDYDRLRAAALESLAAREDA